MPLFTKRERSLIFSGLKKSWFLKSMLLLNFLIQWSWNILYLFNISTMLNKWIIRWFWVDVTTKAQLIYDDSKWLTREFIYHIWISIRLPTIKLIEKNHIIKIYFPQCMELTNNSTERWKASLDSWKLVLPEE